MRAGLAGTQPLQTCPNQNEHYGEPTGMIWSGEDQTEVDVLADVAEPACVIADKLVQINLVVTFHQAYRRW